MDFIASLSDLALTIGSFLVALGVIIFVHEYGHYIVGRWTGIRPEVFSIGMGPAVKQWRDRHGTVWQIAAFPIGGYVRFAGDADPASATTDSAALAALDPEARRHTMAGAPIWARTLTVAAGPVFNFILSILVFGGLVWATGIATDEPVIGEIKPLPQAELVARFKPGDRILSVDGHPVGSYAELYEFAASAPPAPSQRYEIARNGERLSIEGPFAFPPVVDAVQPRSAAADAGLRPGDVIIAAEGNPVHAFTEMQELVRRTGERPITLEIWRDGEIRSFTLVPRKVDLPRAEGGFETRYLIGVTGGLFFAPQTVRPNPVSALLIGAQQTWGVVMTSLDGLSHVVRGLISTCNLAGPVGIAETSGDAAAQGLSSFIWFIGVLSTAIGLLNLFPIPVLDGGHLVFFAYEAVVGRKPSDTAMRVLMTLGLSLLLGLMVFALFNDLFC